MKAADGLFVFDANAGFHHVVNSNHIEGHTVNRFEGRLQATLGIGRRGVLQ